MAINLTSEFSSSDRIRVAIYLSPYSRPNINDITGQTSVLEAGHSEASKPPALGMGTIGYKTAYIDRKVYEANKTCLKSAVLDGRFKMDYEEGRYIYCEAELGNPCSFANGDTLETVRHGSVMKLAYMKVILQSGDVLVNRDGRIIAVVEKTQEQNPENNKISVFPDQAYG